jgi:hypothetical protein
VRPLAPDGPSAPQPASAPAAARGNASPGAKDGRGLLDEFDEFDELLSGLDKP